MLGGEAAACPGHSDIEPLASEWLLNLELFTLDVGFCGTVYFDNLSIHSANLVYYPRFLNVTEIYSS